MSSNKVKISLAWQMMIGLALGVVVGAMVDAELAKTYLQPLGDLFIRLIRMVVVPLVIATIIAGAAGISDTSKLGRVATKVLIVYAITTAISVTIGLLFAGAIQPGMGLDLSTEGLQAKAVTPPKLVDTLLAIVPINPMDAFAKGNMLQIIFFAVIFGFGLSGLGERGKPVLKFFEIVGDTMIRVTHMVMLYAPIGVFGLMSYTVSRHGLGVLLPLAKLILSSFLATATMVFVILVPMVMILGKTPMMKFLKGIFEPWLIAFTTCSSAAALPANLTAARKLGATKSIASFSIPLGNTVNMNGTAVYMGVCSIFAAEVYGLDLTMADQITIVLMGVLAAVGTAGVPGAGLIMTTIVFTQVGIPLEAVALIAGVDRILDMIRTSINVVGDVASAIVVTNMEGDLDSEPYVEGES
ncbi:MAG: dicarboxylate/amino acid:cation symporter [Sutterella parvirubra]|uniref:Putative proton/sodium-glutamate symport protein GltT n=1 Tax=Sutterella parvirubra YIT 11816 TaxID=762967 RepID=H3KHT7_9BURK|nr:dicarboxylate/amino acid:cation symporter [Sutterella parvirubra]EHY30320.1 putative proton/sodium-glutamate symport protein GltT [Sutterella parvirubra YIT 11816]MCI7709151.1 dicarboxylate/amino acid:cation symporter [Sutterella parvirubra]MDY5201224.1 dicarboxylate/amino acid:cation symporter [Sutterella parvirubra]